MQLAIHWWLGRAVVVLALVNIFLGLQEYNLNFDDMGDITLNIRIGFIGIVVFIAFVFLAAEFMLGQTPLAVSNYCDGTNVCVTGGKDLDGSIAITVQAAGKGWAGFGIGSQMAGSSMYLAWKNSTGGIVLSPRQATGHIIPQPSPEHIATLIATPSYVTPQPWANIVFSFKRPVSSNTSTIMATSSYIYAIGNTPPPNPDSSATSPGIHDQKGMIGGLDLTVSLAGNSTGTPQTNVPGSPGSPRPMPSPTLTQGVKGTGNSSTRATIGVLATLATCACTLLLSLVVL
eukprot:jgi/Hompol1/1128/HPOL_000048-RA